MGPYSQADLLVLGIQEVLLHPCLLQCRLLPHQDNHEDQVVQEDRGGLGFLKDHMAQEGHKNQEDPSPQYIQVDLSLHLVPEVQFQILPLRLSLQEVQVFHPVPGFLWDQMGQEFQAARCYL